MNKKNNHWLIIGGAKSGKSAYALKLAKKLIKNGVKDKNRLFIATSKAKDDEMRQKIEAHKKERGPLWHTIEEEIKIGYSLKKEIGKFDVAIIDCITMWITNLILTCPEQINSEIDYLIDSLKESKAPVILISNEVGLGIIPENRLARRFREELGLANQKLASLCQNVVFMMAGLTLKMK